MVGQMDREPVEPVRDRRAGGTPRFVVGPEHEMIDKELRASSEEISEGRYSFVGLEPILLVDSHPGQLLSLPRQLVTAPRQFLLGLEQLPPGRKPFFLRNNLMFLFHLQSPIFQLAISLSLPAPCSELISCSSLMITH